MVANTGDYARYLYKGSANKVLGLVGPIDYLLVVRSDPTTTADRYTFYDTNTTTGNVLRILDVYFTDSGKGIFDYAKRVS